VSFEQRASLHVLGNQIVVRASTLVFVGYRNNLIVGALTCCFRDGVSEVCDNLLGAVRRRAAYAGLDRQIDDGQPTVRCLWISGEKSIHGRAQRLVGRRADGAVHDAASAFNGAMSLRLRSLSRRSASRWRGGSLLFFSNASASAIEASHGGRCRRLRQEFGQRSGAQFDSIGSVRALSGDRFRQRAVAGSKKQSFRCPT